MLFYCVVMLVCVTMYIFLFDLIAVRYISSVCSSCWLSSDEHDCLISCPVLQLASIVLFYYACVCFMALNSL